MPWIRVQDSVHFFEEIEMSVRKYMGLALALASMVCLGCSEHEDGAVCGNGHVETGETCDDGNASGGDGCSAQCGTEPGWTCPDEGVACVKSGNGGNEPRPEGCGNGIVEDTETCDDGNQADGDGCSALCFKENKAFYAPNPGPVTKCNDGKHEAGEVCDPKYGYTLDGEARTCLVTEAGACVLSRSTAGKSDCGTGTVEDGEACDDGNSANGDGCSAKCKVEPDSVCRMKNGAHGSVLLVVDGDTLKVRLDNGDCDPDGAVTIRLHGIDTPECAKDTRVSTIDPSYSAKAYIQDDTYTDKNERGGYEASVFANDLIYAPENQGSVEIECETRSASDATCLLDATNSRYLAYIKLKKDGVYTDLANELVKAGHGMVYTDFTSQRLEKYCTSEKAAVQAKAGFWSYADSFEEAVKLLSEDKQRYMTHDHCD